MPTPLAAVDPSQAVTSHQTSDLASPDLAGAAQDQFGVDPPDSVGRPGSGMNLDDRVQQIRVLDVAARGWPLGPLVVARGRDAQDPARHRDGEPVGGKLMNEPEPYFGRTFSRAK